MSSHHAGQRHGMTHLLPMMTMGLLLLQLLGEWAIVEAHPLLVECVCNTTRAMSAVVGTTTGSNDKYALPSCITDVFAETGIRWFTNGPFRGDIAYESNPRVGYATGRAAQRLIALGYRCEVTQLYDPTEVIE